MIQVGLKKAVERIQGRLSAKKYHLPVIIYGREGNTMETIPPDHSPAVLSNRELGRMFLF